ncbi:ABC transporter, permease protein [Pseudonocardia sp. Ae168_Ps1]|uniref:carbohydrate ABC transporter permease n=1 Tax=unclassified Pseudonocardia TaxID=2619320 RepID=UPI00094AF629|nr:MULTISPECIES: sugar ABC transporter permease [unclassified Pseudonocardia]OLL70992.1 ABC transporter, permease protein [Pseudonocardia sp. Ae168_Ps1]OLL77458.1 ABC transporter, permease protein [Pseudonocardia sp. Ae150A_Ps1]OLL88430.1 ABC transporter, permease protein [Pseudonocardia sp. Ae263_Ps1]OLL91547.1 ABC transporter, permease protein [Pseudonocardia sp. Ae356_Ps1]
MRRREFLGLVSPSLLVMLGLLQFPLYKTVEWSLQRVNYGEPGTFLGLDNYAQALSDPRLGRAVLFTVGLTAAVIAVLLVGGYLLAVLVNGLGRSRPWVLGVLLVSYVVPNVVGATMFSWLFDSNFGGVVNYLITELTGQEILWFTDPWANRVMVGLNTVWFMLPFAMLVILAGLQGVPPEVVEAARIDGATGWRVHWHVIVPSIRGVLTFVSIISIMDVLRTFDQLIPLSPQAPQIGNESIMLYIYNIAFQDGGQQLGLGSAINVLLILLIVLLLSPFIRDMAKEARQ